MPPSKPNPPAQGPRYPYTIHRIYLCGHPEEYTQIERAQNTSPPRILHTLVPRPRVVQGVSVRPYRQIREQCIACTSPSSSAKTHGRPLSRGGRVKNGFLQVLVRERFSGVEERAIRWPEEREGGVGNEEFRRLKELHDNFEAQRNVSPHSAVAYQDRAERKMVKGPAREGGRKVAYVLQTAVDAVLAEGLGHEIFYDGEAERARLIEDINELLSPRVEDRGSRESTQAQLQAVTRANSQKPHPRTPPAPSPRSPPTQRSPAQHPRRPRPHSPTRSQQEIARNRALALATLEGRPFTPTPPERHSDTPPQPPARRPSLRPNPTNVPSYISHQRPFGPTRPSGGTTLSYGDNPRGYNHADTREEVGVSIGTVLETLWPEREEGEGGGTEGRGSYGSFRSFESQRHPGLRVRSRGSVESYESVGDGGRGRGRGDRGSVGSLERGRGSPRSPRGWWS
ncbi:hypothetical protein P171DRAFT_441975 [Karstenula rhodostoma CBS 690.94]|uniref:Uncharacterized protein n=1 Tax=Karstenula rhodostoma CBS 690.94 TaxID=1392251 RepID=A0A9P4PNY7_9PLEO|nr:hypothetical protein P171DRAFT_441975 [Karstenula rhodostoma CBS 690.94]